MNILRIGKRVRSVIIDTVKPIHRMVPRHDRWVSDLPQDYPMRPHITDRARGFIALHVIKLERSIRIGVEDQGYALGPDHRNNMGRRHTVSEKSSAGRTLERRGRSHSSIVFVAEIAGDRRMIWKPSKK